MKHKQSQLPQGFVALRFHQLCNFLLKGHDRKLSSIAYPKLPTLLLILDDLCEK